jgi:hypothetical protein
VSDLFRHGPIEGEGRFWVRRGRGVFARALTAALRLPRPGDRVPVRLDVERTRDGETWTRTFAGRPLVTTLRVQPDGSVDEQLGPITLRHAVRRDGDTTTFRLVWARVFGVPVPQLVRPRCLSIHRVHGGRAYVYTLASYRGRLVLAYAGWIS